MPGFSWEVKDEPDLSAAAVNRLRNVQRTYNKYYIQVRPWLARLAGRGAHAQPLPALAGLA